MSCKWRHFAWCKSTFLLYLKNVLQTFWHRTRNRRNIFIFDLWCNQAKSTNTHIENTKIITLPPVIFRFSHPLISPGGEGGGKHLTALWKFDGKRLGSCEQFLLLSKVVIGDVISSRVGDLMSPFRFCFFLNLDAALDERNMNFIIIILQSYSHTLYL